MGSLRRKPAKVSLDGEGMDDVVAAARAYLSDPSLHADGWRWIAEYVAGKIDGRAGERMADALLDVIASHPAATSVR